MAEGDDSARPAFLSGDEIIKARGQHTPSEERVESLATTASSQFAEAAATFVRQRELDAYIWAGDALPPLEQGGLFKYRLQYSEIAERLSEGERLVVALVTRGGETIGFGIAVQGATDSEIELINVTHLASRSAGLHETLEITGTTFQVGVAHAVVATLVNALRRPIRVDATNSPSRYVFKSLGFVHQEGTANPCLLVLLPEAHA